ncbi:MAG TPA: ATP-dependent DNA ligase [Gemmatimonadota bacterium]|nr:ATP-dependent DNA ligase [Gemmatimonadota bacterium]
MLLSEIVDTSRRVAVTSGRLEKIRLMADLLERTPGAEIEIAVAFLSGSPRQGRLGVGPALLRRAWPGTAAEAPALELAAVDERLAKIGVAGGPGSTAERVRLLEDLLRRATPAEQEFLGGLVLGELRQGALESLVAEAVARAAAAGGSDVRRALAVTADLGAVARAVLSEDAPDGAGFAIELFRPLRPMLAQPAEDVAGSLARLGEAALEVKLDGARVQIHKSGPDVAVYSRRLNDVTAAVPEVVEAALRLPAREAILDGEAIALRPDGTPHPFQVTMRRFGRRLDVERMREELPLSVLLFDLLLLDGTELLAEPLSRRSATLADLSPPDLLIPRIVTADASVAEEFMAGALARGHEGLMAKALGSPYQAGSRGGSWLKIKPVQSLDLVVLAAEWGHGRRKGWLSNLHLGARDTEAGGFAMLGKTFKGMTDRMLAWQTERLLALETSRDGHVVHVRPELVVEVAFNDVQASPTYPGGVALRFARVRRYRPDKRADQADTLATVREIHRRMAGGEPR